MLLWLLHALPDVTAGFTTCIPRVNTCVATQITTCVPRVAGSVTVFLQADKKLASFSRRSRRQVEMESADDEDQGQSSGILVAKWSVISEFVALYTEHTNFRSYGP